MGKWVLWWEGVLSTCGWVVAKSQLQLFLNVWAMTEHMWVWTAFILHTYVSQTFVAYFCLFIFFGWALRFASRGFLICVDSQRLWLIAEPQQGTKKIIKSLGKSGSKRKYARHLILAFSCKEKKRHFYLRHSKRVHLPEELLASRLTPHPHKINGFRRHKFSI